ncbi:hypothetical protein BH09PSE2_BH09PSE2_06530 [soil metagenome]
MSDITYRGVVHPSVYELTFEYSESVSRSQTDDEPPCEMTFDVSGGSCYVRVVLSEATNELALRLFTVALTSIQNIVNAVGFLEGIPFRVELQSFQVDGGSVEPVTLVDRSLPRRALVRSLEQSDLVELSLTNPGVGQIISDALIMLDRINYAPIAGGRIADTISREMHGSHGREAWKMMREHLNVDRAYVSLLSDRSKGPRHGQREYSPGPLVNTIAERSWTLIGRYLAWLQGGKVPLAEGSHPRLLG